MPEQLTLPIIMKHNHWILGTHANGTKRSSQLLALDQAIKALDTQRSTIDSLLCQPSISANFLATNYFKHYFESIADAFRLWKWEKNGKNGTVEHLKSVRNEKGAIGELEAQIKSANDWLYLRTDSELIAWWKGKVENQYQDIFRGTKLKPKSLKVLSTAYSISKAKDLPDQIQRLIDTIKKKAFLNAAQPEDEWAQQVLCALLEELCSRAVAQFVKDHIPVFNAVSSIVGAITAGKAAYKEHKAVNYLANFGKKLPDGAMSTVISAVEMAMAERETFHLVSAARNAAKGTVGVLNLCTAGVGQGVTTATMLIATITEVTQAACTLQKEVEQASEANRHILAKNTIDRDIFVKCPLLGAHYILMADTSAIAALLVDFGHVGWMDEVERIVREDIPGLQEAAQTLIEASPFELLMADNTPAKLRIEKSLLDKIVARLKNRKPVKYHGQGHNHYSN